MGEVKVTDRSAQVFRKGLYSWHEDIHRDMPWKETNDPYRIWISEIILQQTRVAQGRQYYERLIKRFPNVKALASASEDDVLAQWKGLGYYARARNLHKAAQMIVDQHNGIFPNTYEDVIALPGIGPYAAAAITSFAFDLPYAVLDGNVFRVLSRYNGVDTPIDTTAGKKMFSTLSQMLLDTKNPAKYNQAIMDFGALLCKPSVPDCANCTLRESCQGYHDGIVDLLPIKSKKVKVKRRYFHYFLFISDQGVYMERREAADIWKGLYQLPLIEGPKRYTKKEVVAEVKILHGPTSKITKLYSATQQLTHRLIHGDFYLVEGSDKLPKANWVAFDKVRSLGTPKIVDDFLKGHLDLDGEYTAQKKK